MSEEKKNAKHKRRDMTHRMRDPRLWKPGEPLTKEDQQMLNVVRRRARQLGYSPTRKEVATSGRLRERFRIWADVLEAAGLPGLNDPEQARKRMKAREWERSMQDILGVDKSNAQQHAPGRGI